MTLNHKCQNKALEVFEFLEGQEELMCGGALWSLRDNRREYVEVELKFLGVCRGQQKCVVNWKYV